MKRIDNITDTGISTLLVRVLKLIDLISSSIQKVLCDGVLCAVLSNPSASEGIETLLTSFEGLLEISCQLLSKMKTEHNGLLTFTGNPYLDSSRRLYSMITSITSWQTAIATSCHFPGPPQRGH